MSSASRREFDSWGSMVKWIPMPELAMPVCQICGTSIHGSQVSTCKACLTPHHIDCWEYLGGCSIFACACPQCAAS